MRGWIYVATAADRGGRVWIGHAAADPATEAGWLSGAPRRIAYDAVVAAPQDAVAMVHARLAPLAAPDGAFRCSPEFAIAAIHHALGGPPEGERIYLDDENLSPPPRVPVDALAALAARGARRERGGTLRALVASGVALLIVAALVLHGGTGPAVRDARPPAAAEETRVSTPALHRNLPPATADAAPGVPADPRPPSDLAPPAQPPAVPGAPPMTAADCRRLWSTVLPRCAGLPKRACGNAERRLTDGDRGRIRAQDGFNATAFANFCRAACRHGYRPSRDDFALNVCRAPG